MTNDTQDPLDVIEVVFKQHRKHIRNSGVSFKQMDEALAAVQELQEREGWRDISSAPWGQEVLVVWLDETAVASTRRMKTPKGDGWSHGVENPTHWKPLDFPPKDTGASDE